jgi:hypothetical protein
MLSGGLGLCVCRLPSVRSRAGPWRPRQGRAVHAPVAILLVGRQCSCRMWAYLTLYVGMPAAVNLMVLKKFLGW